MHEQHVERTRGMYTICDDKRKIRADAVRDFLLEAGWIKDPERIPKILDGSLLFGVYHQDQQVGFARVVTDFATIALLADVFIREEHRGKGLGKWLVETILSHPRLSELNWLLKTTDAHGLYRKFGFSEIEAPEEYMMRRALLSDNTRTFSV